MEGGWLVGNGGELLAGTGGGGAGGLASIYRLRRRRAFAITLDKKNFFVMQHAGIELGPHRYDATLLTSTLCYTRWSFLGWFFRWCIVLCR